MVEALLAPCHAIANEGHWGASNMFLSWVLLAPWRGSQRYLRWSIGPDQHLFRGSTTMSIARGPIWMFYSMSIVQKMPEQISIMLGNMTSKCIYMSRIHVLRTQVASIFSTSNSIGCEVVPPHRTSTVPAELEWHDFGRPAVSTDFGAAKTPKCANHNREHGKRTCNSYEQRKHEPLSRNNSTT